MNPGTGGRLPGADRRLLKGYGPLAVLLLVYALIVTLTPSVAREELVGTGAGAAGIATRPGNDQPIDGTTGGADAAAGTPGSTPTGGPTPTGGSAAPGEVASGATSSCGAQQVPGDPYSPPCITFEGDNGGTTHRGVDGDSITVGYRITSDPGLQAQLSQLAGNDFPQETADDLRRTMQALVQYFNDRFQFYGRRLELVEFQGRGAALNESLGGGQDLANADAIKAAQEVGAFVDVSAFTEPYANALVQQGVMALGAPYMSAEWFQQRAPFAWSVTPDCTQLAELNIAAYLRYLHGHPAEFAGGDLRGKPRKMAIVAPNTPVYQQCVDAAIAKLDAAGVVDIVRLDYTLDPGSMSTQAGNLVDQMQARGVTSAALGTDPLLPLFLTQKAAERGYKPEWLVLGTALTDSDIAGQQYDQDQWSRAFGISQLGPQTDARGTYGYHAYKSVRPDDEPSMLVDIFYYQLYQLAIGVQMAGPNLTPDSFAQGMFAYPGGSGLAGTWGFAPGDYTAQDDGVAIWWDPDAMSPYNGKPGAYIQASERATASSLPDEPPTYFRR
jgi:hypothetical protein